MKKPFSELPVVEYLDEILASVNNYSRLIIESPPGTGKSTLVPLTLANKWVPSGQKILVLEPRRMAARMLARFTAELLSEKVGETIGFRHRGEHKSSRQTKVEFITEGILTRMIQNDPELPGIAMIIFDEFHERSLQGDLGLAFAQEIQENLRPELKILILSATLETERITQLLQTHTLQIPGKSFPVKTDYCPAKKGEYYANTVVRGIVQSLNKGQGTILVILPGMKEIRETARVLEESSITLPVHTLHGSMKIQAQEAALAPLPNGERKIVLATAIAESSLTIANVDIVVDGGLLRQDRFSPGTGLSGLETVTVTRDAADQRRGRAGRVRPGFCCRLWSEKTDHQLIEARTPAIFRSDLTPLLLELAQWGDVEGKNLHWIDPPPLGAVKSALRVLQQLQAIDSQGKITKIGRKMVNMPLHPRLASMIISAKSQSQKGKAAVVASLLENNHSHQSDFQQLLQIQDQEQNLLSKELCQRLNLPCLIPTLAEAAELLLYAWPDRVGKLRHGSRNRYQLSGGRGASLYNNSPLAGSEFIMALALNDQGQEAKIQLAIPLEIDVLRQCKNKEIQKEIQVEWLPEKRQFRQIQLEKFASLTLSSQSISTFNKHLFPKAVINTIKDKGLELLPWKEKAESLCLRVETLRTFASFRDFFPDFSEEGMLMDVENWLLPFLTSLKKTSDFQHLPIYQAVKTRLTWQQQQELDRLAPTHQLVPSGSKIRITYSQHQSPYLSVKLQEMFGASKTPCIADGQIPLVLHLLSPAMRPLQVTSNLETFWREVYPEVRKDLRGRYPKHSWPENPFAIIAHRGTKRNEEKLHE